MHLTMPLSVYLHIPSETISGTRESDATKRRIDGLQRRSDEYARGICNEMATRWAVVNLHYSILLFRSVCDVCTVQ
jgi:hypothetical protein